MPTAEEWLAARLKAGGAPPQAVTNEALSHGFTLADVLLAKKALGLQSTRGPNSDTLWSLPATVVEAPIVAPVTKVIPKTQGKPEESVLEAHNIIKRATPAAASAVVDLVARASEDAPACPACGRGMPRAEELRLKAATVVLDRGGLSPAKAPSDMGETGPMIILPPGTRLGIAVMPPEQDRRPDGAIDIKVTRGDHVAPTPPENQQT